jgi:sec-independent protein translocase protein TatA
MLRNFSGWEMLVVLAIVLLVFGVGRISKIAGEMGSGIRAFRKGIKGDEEEQEPSDQEEPPK